MQYSSRLAIATHILMAIENFHEDYKITSEFLASTVNVNPVIIRNTLGKLKKAGLVRVEAGVGGATLAKKREEITLLDIFHAVEPQEDLFHFHENPNPECPVGRNIHPILHAHMVEAQEAMEASLAQHTLEDLMNELATRL